LSDCEPDVSRDLQPVRTAGFEVVDLDQHFFARFNADGVRFDFPTATANHLLVTAAALHLSRVVPILGAPSHRGIDMHDDGLHHRRAMLRKLGQVARALLEECQGAENVLSGEETSKREIAAACLVRHAAQLEVQIRRAGVGPEVRT
jgi:hypothetical protein